MSEIRPRIVGTEMEWSIASSKTSYIHMVQHTDVDEIHQRYLDGQLVRPYESSSRDMLSNGARLYKDINNHIEYATPEDTSLWGTVVNELAGERLLSRSLTEYVLAHQAIKFAQLHKRLLSDDGRTTGHHMNLSADHKAVGHFDDDTMHLLGLHLASSQALLGAGAIYEKRDANHRLTGEYNYSYGQKVLDLTCDYDNATTVGKPLVNQRDQDLARGTGLARVHITSADANISPWASWMNLGTSSLVLRAIEQGSAERLRYRSHRYFESSSSSVLAQLARASALDLSQTHQVTMADGRQMTPLTMQEAIIDIVADTDHTDEEAEVLSEWQRAVGDMQTNMGLLIDRSDAVAKLALIRRRAKQLGYTPGDYNHKELAAYDRMYGVVAAVDTTEGVAAIDPAAVYDESFVNSVVRARITTARKPDNVAVEQAMYEPPRTTRAYRRGHLIATGKVRRASWERLKVDGTTNEVILNDPYDDEFLATPSSSSDSR